MIRNVASEKGKSGKIVVWLLLVAYFLVMVDLLFLGNRSSMEFRSINLQPMDTIRRYFYVLSSDSNNRWAIMNLVGNIAMFMPMGLFLPWLWKKQGNFLLFSLTTLLVICTAEALQYFLCLGSADVDDLILNYPGAVVGFLFYKLFSRRDKS